MSRLDIARALYPQIFKDVDMFRQLVSKQQIIIEFVNNNLERVKSESKPVQALKPDEQSAIDKYLSSKYSTAKNIAYENKRAVAAYYDNAKAKSAKKIKYSVYLNQMITPNAFEVQKFKKEFSGISDNYSFFQTAGDAVAKRTKWVDEQDLYDSGDYFLYPEEALTGMSQATDCEDVSNLVASLKSEICATCYGFMTVGKSKFGHAFPVFLYQNKLYIVETTGDSVEIVPIEDNRYDPVFFITLNNTYRTRTGVEFGKLASF